MLGEAAFVDLRETHLTDSRGRLQFVDFAWPPSPTKPLHAFGNRARTDQHHFLALRAQRCDLRGPTADRSMIEAAPVIGDEARADFHYQSP
jgi:hypothetical protein